MVKYRTKDAPNLNMPAPDTPNATADSPILDLPDYAKPESAAPILDLPLPADAKPAPILDLPLPADANPAPILDLPLPADAKPAPILDLPLPADAATRIGRMTKVEIEEKIRRKLNRLSQDDRVEILNDLLKDEENANPDILKR
jgi:hypothetical protein